jgi:hypothetical protein
MEEQGIQDFLAAKRKAAARYGVSDGAVLPRNTEIEAALIARQRLFGSQPHARSLAAQRQAALQAMKWLQQFQPRLVGPVLTGSATEHAEIQLHLFADRAESVTLLLLENRIDYDVIERRQKMNAERVLALPGLRFEVDGYTVEATVFPVDGIRQAPTSPVDGKPMRRADRDEVAALMESAPLLL